MLLLFSVAKVKKKKCYKEEQAVVFDITQHCKATGIFVVGLFVKGSYQRNKTQKGQEA